VQPTNQLLFLPDYNACALGFKVLQLLIEIHHATTVEPREKDDTRDHTPFVLPLTHSKLIMPSATHQNAMEK